MEIECFRQRAGTVGERADQGGVALWWKPQIQAVCLWRRVLEAGEEDHDCSWSLMVGLQKNQALAGRVFPCGLPRFSMEKASGRQAGRKCDGLHVGSWLVTKDLAATGQGTVDPDGLGLHKLEVFPGGGSTLGTVGGGDNGSVGVHGTLLELLGRVAILWRRVGSRRCCLLSGAGARRWMRPDGISLGVLTAYWNCFL